MASSAVPRAISQLDSSRVNSWGSMSATWGKASTACPCSHLAVSSSASRFSRPWSRMTAPVASRTGTCQSLVAMLLSSERVGGIVAKATYFLRAALPGTGRRPVDDVLWSGPPVTVAERAFYPVCAPVWWEAGCWSRPGREAPWKPRRLITLLLAGLAAGDGRLVAVAATREGRATSLPGLWLNEDVAQRVAAIETIVKGFQEKSGVSVKVAAIAETQRWPPRSSRPAPPAPCPT